MSKDETKQGPPRFPIAFDALREGPFQKEFATESGKGDTHQERGKGGPHQ